MAHEQGIPIDMVVESGILSLSDLRVKSTLTCPEEDSRTLSTTLPLQFGVQYPATLWSLADLLERLSHSRPCVKTTFFKDIITGEAYVSITVFQYTIEIVYQYKWNTEV